MQGKYLPALAAVSALVVSVASAQEIPGYTTYVFINGIPTDVSAYSSFGGGHVFLNGVWIGTLNSSGQIIGAQSQFVGYIVPID
jgi:hypothetical protein